MEKERAFEKLKELGIETQNYHNKKTYVWKDRVCVGIFPVEADREEKFYFSINTEDKLYMIDSSLIKGCIIEQHFGKDKYQVPLSFATLIWEDKAYIEPVDENFKNLTIRDLVAIIHKKPISGKDWLNILIKQL
jgi:hypothetical protein